MRSESLFGDSLAICLLNVTGVLYNGDCWLLGESRTVDMKPAENPKWESIILKPIKNGPPSQGIAIFDALKFEIVRNTRPLKRKCGHSRNHTLRFPLRCRGVFLLFTLPTVWLVSFFLSESEPPPSRLGKLCRRLQAAEMLPYRLVA